MLRRTMQRSFEPYDRPLLPHGLGVEPPNARCSKPPKDKVEQWVGIHSMHHSATLNDIVFLVVLYRQLRANLLGSQPLPNPGQVFHQVVAQQGPQPDPHAAGPSENSV